MKFVYLIHNIICFLGCPPTHYGPLCSKLCPEYCSGPCDLEIGNCTYGCANGWIGVKCELGMKKVFYVSKPVQVLVTCILTTQNTQQKTILRFILPKGLSQV